MMLAGTINRGKTEDPLGETGYKVVAVMFFGKKEVARFRNDERLAVVSCAAFRRRCRAGASLVAGAK